MRRSGTFPFFLVAFHLFLCARCAPAETVRVLDRHVDAFQARIALIDGAAEVISVAYYQYEDRPLTRVFFAHLRRAARRGVRVRVLIDACNSVLPGSYMRRLMADGLEFREYHPPRWLQPCRWACRLHDKLLVVDGRAMIVGGRNIGDRYFGLAAEGNFRDRDVLVAGAAAGHAQAYFQRMWCSRHVAPLPGSAAAEVRRRLVEPPRLVDLQRLIGTVTQWPDAVGVGSSILQFCGGNDGFPPAFWRKAEKLKPRPLADCGCTGARPPEFAAPGSDRLLRAFVVPPQAVRFVHSDRVVDGCGDITDELLALIDSARWRIVIETPYLMLTDRFRTVLRRAVARGVRVQITTNSLATTNQPLAHAGYLSQRRELLNSGIDLWEYQGRQTLHNKTWIVDETVMIGSYNLDPRCEVFDTQTAVIIHDARFAEAMLTVMAGERYCHAARLGRNGKPAFSARSRTEFGNEETPAPLWRRTWMPVMRLLAPLMKRHL